MSATLDRAGTLAALRDGVVARVTTRDVVVLDGPDAAAYLQGQVSQDLEPLAVGGATEALVLSPQGKLDQYVSVARTDEERFVLLVEAGHGEALYERLRRFKLRVKATLEQSSIDVVELRGPLASAPAGLPEQVLAVPFGFASFTGVDLVGDGVAVPDDVPVGDESAFEAARISAGVPRMGSELTEKTIPQEAGIVERTVSFTKGCYTGQELVARLDARGNNVPRHLRLLRSAGPLAPDEVLVFDGKDVGWVTSVASGDDGAVALAYVGRAVEPPAEIVVRGAAGEHPVSVEALPSPA